MLPVALIHSDADCSGSLEHHQWQRGSLLHEGKGRTDLRESYRCSSVLSGALESGERQSIPPRPFNLCDDKASCGLPYLLP